MTESDFDPAPFSRFHNSKESFDIEKVLEKAKSYPSGYSDLLTWLLKKTVSELDLYFRIPPEGNYPTGADIKDKYLTALASARDLHALEKTLASYIRENVASLRNHDVWKACLPKDDPCDLKLREVITTFLSKPTPDENAYQVLARQFKGIINNLDAFALEAEMGLPWLLQYESSNGRTITLRQLKLDASGPKDAFYDHVGVLMYLIHLTLAPNEPRQLLHREWRKYRVEALKKHEQSGVTHYPKRRSRLELPSSDLDISFMKNLPRKEDYEINDAVDFYEIWGFLYLSRSPIEIFGSSRPLNEWHSLPAGSKSAWNFFKSRMNKIVDQYLKLHNIADGVASAQYNPKQVPGFPVPQLGFSRLLKGESIKMK